MLIMLIISVFIVLHFLSMYQNGKNQQANIDMLIAHGNFVHEMAQLTFHHMDDYDDKYYEFLTGKWVDKLPK